MSASIIGIDVFTVEVEVDISLRGLPHFTMVGLPDVAVKESKVRFKAALKNKLGLFVRVYTRILKLSCTITDLEEVRGDSVPACF